MYIEAHVAVRHRIGKWLDAPIGSCLEKSVLLISLARRSVDFPQYSTDLKICCCVGYLVISTLVLIESLDDTKAIETYIFTASGEVENEYLLAWVSKSPSGPLGNFVFTSVKALDQTTGLCTTFSVLLNSTRTFWFGLNGTNLLTVDPETITVATMMPITISIQVRNSNDSRLFTTSKFWSAFSNFGHAFKEALLSRYEKPPIVLRKYGPVSDPAPLDEVPLKDRIAHSSFPKLLDIYDPILMTKLFLRKLVAFLCGSEDFLCGNEKDGEIWYGIVRIRIASLALEGIIGRTERLCLNEGLELISMVDPLKVGKALVLYCGRNKHAISLSNNVRLRIQIATGQVLYPADGKKAIG
ncbi:uncharacterized protein BDR25DRAFT_354498 [Lindgomyces ingoldianus]|uniref:Uncharacterized protein n=1 Tax=Lindgomyces ingoldianus TaxID=673940 RepID=A0ACB6QWQ2_9PLEO|nr:uncharacterized protein BDR25DRAFT_354498 [Lindgomyces ingoldianus]KAF2471242.1 hypothetical protein BDR25DRAFT_354498 [Lindgomyces ingoldianus]